MKKVCIYVFWVIAIAVVPAFSSEEVPAKVIEVSGIELTIPCPEDMDFVYDFTENNKSFMEFHRDGVTFRLIAGGGQNSFFSRKVFANGNAKMLESLSKRYPGFVKDFEEGDILLWSAEFSPDKAGGEKKRIHQGSIYVKSRIVLPVCEFPLSVNYDESRRLALKWCKDIVEANQESSVALEGKDIAIPHPAGFEMMPATTSDANEKVSFVFMCRNTDGYEGVFYAVFVPMESGDGRYDALSFETSKKHVMEKSKRGNVKLSEKDLTLVDEDGLFSRVTRRIVKSRKEPFNSLTGSTLIRVGDRIVYTDITLVGPNEIKNSELVDRIRAWRRAILSANGATE